jgi:hypothetical protein
MDAVIRAIITYNKAAICYHLRVRHIGVAACGKLEFDCNTLNINSNLLA